MGISILHRKDSLILTTVDIIEELGIQGLTTREIAKRQKVSEATLFRHYKNKNELLLAVLSFYEQYDSDIFLTICQSGLKPMDAIKQYVMKYAEYYQNYPAITSITQVYDVLRYDAELEGKILDIQHNRISMMTQLVEVAQNADEIRKDYSAEMIAVMILGFFREICLNWRLEKYDFSLCDRVKDSLDLYLESLQMIKK